MARHQYTEGRSSIDTTVAIIDTIAFLCTQLSRRNLDAKEAKKAISNLQYDEKAFRAFKRLSMTDEDIANRELISRVAQSIKDKHTPIEL